MRAYPSEPSLWKAPELVRKAPILYRSLPVKKFDEISGTIWSYQEECVYT